MISIKRLSPGDWEQFRALRLLALGDAPEAFSQTLEKEETYPGERWRERLESAATFAASNEIHRL